MPVFGWSYRCTPAGLREAEGVVKQLELNPQQREAVYHGGGPLLVFAGAGSGKTRILTARVARLIQEDVPPDRILAVTFTNKAAGEMRDRIQDLTGRSMKGLWIGTFHSVGARLLRREAGVTTRTRNFTIYDEGDARRTVKEAMASLDHDTGKWDPRLVRGRISAAKNELADPILGTRKAWDPMRKVVQDVYPAYEKALKQANAYDFDDLLRESVLLFERNPDIRERWAGRFLHVMVDEYQDTNRAQYLMVKALASVHGNICVVGDDDQAIYGWRGADIRNIQDFEHDFTGAHVVKLERNYRSRDSILRVANAVISQNLERRKKRLVAHRGPGKRVQVLRCETDRDEAACVLGIIESAGHDLDYADFAVAYRTNAQSRTFEEAFRRAGVPYIIVGGVPFYERREIRDVLAYLSLLVNEDDNAAFLRAVRWPRRGVGQKTLDRLRALPGQRDQSLLVAARGARVEDGIGRAALRGLRRFVSALDDSRELVQDHSAQEAMEHCIATFALSTALEAEEDGEDRLRNVSELLATAALFRREDVDDDDPLASELELYLQSVALQSDIDEADFESDAVTLITLHSAKGLEFPVVFLAGLDDGLFPLARAVDRGELEEERRLFYVGVTRAMDRLYITHADQRYRWGTRSRSAPSLFLDDLPEEHVSWRRAPPRWARHRRPRPYRRSGKPRFERTTRELGSARNNRSRVQDEVRGNVLRYDHSDSQEPLLLTPGARVIHGSFGAGEIVSVGGDGKIEIVFDDIGRKKLVLAYAGLRPE